MEIHIYLYREEGNLSHGLHLFQKGLFPFLPDSSLQSVFFPCFSSVILSAAKNLSIVPDLLSNLIDGILQYGLFQLTLPNDDDIPPFGL